MTYTLHDLIPHRDAMLLLGDVIDVTETSSASRIRIDNKSSFFVPGLGIPSWIGVEYMGQTAAMIAGHQLHKGTVEPHIGLLLGTRKYTAHCAYFPENSVLRISCQELAVVGSGLATFSCEIRDNESGTLYATAKLSVFRKPLNDTTDDSDTQHD